MFDIFKWFQPKKKLNLPEKKLITLPDKPSELIRVAIGDFQKAMEHPDYIIDMGNWHLWHRYHKTCSVCLAGSVMAFSLGADKEDITKPWNYESSIDIKLVALDDFRTGWVEKALGRMNYGNPLSKDRTQYYRNALPHTERTPDCFIPTMLELALELEGHGL